MQNILELIQSGDITTNKLLQSLVQHEDKQVEEFNEVITTLEERDTQLQEHSDILAKQHEALLKQEKDKKTLIANEQDLKRQSVSFQQENKTLRHQLEVAKKEAKATKEQTKRNKAAMKVKDQKIAAFGKKKAPAQDGQLHPLNTVYCVGESVLLIYPQPLELGIDGTKSKQITLLYTNRKGCFLTTYLDNENNVAFSHFINEDADISDRTRKLIIKNTLGIPDDVAEFAQSWLYRVNIVQKMNLEPLDLICRRD